MYKCMNEGKEKGRLCMWVPPASVSVFSLCESFDKSFCYKVNFWCLPSALFMLIRPPILFFTLDSDHGGVQNEGGI